MSQALNSKSKGSVIDDHSSIGSEAKGVYDFSLKDKYQMRAQYITTHKIERKEKKENAKYFLIPHFGFSKEKICFRFDDSVNDIFLEMEALDLCQSDQKLSPVVVLLTWLALNYKIIGIETPACLLDYKSGFHAELHQYKEEIEHPCHMKPSLQKERGVPKDESKLRLCYEKDKKNHEILKSS
jgi:hypothetical protein